MFAQLCFEIELIRLPLIQRLSKRVRGWTSRLMNCAEVCIIKQDKQAWWGQERAGTRGLPRAHNLSVKVMQIEHV